MIGAAQVTFSRGGRRILGPVDCVLRAAQVTAIIGPNGAGKSTLLRILSGAVPPDGGQVEFHGQSLVDWPRDALARTRAVLAQESRLQFAFQVEEVVMLGRTPHLRGFARRADRDIVRATLHRVGMESFARRDYTTLSGGEKQRVQLARALAQIESPPNGHARFLLLDEPVSALDLKYQHEVLRMARTLAGEGIGVVIILHDLNQALEYADHVLAMQYGLIEAEGRPADIITPGLVKKLYGVHATYAVHGERPQLRVRPLDDQRDVLVPPVAPDASTFQTPTPFPTMSDNTSTPTAGEIIAAARRDLDTLLARQQSVILGTVNSQGVPDASYAPAIHDADGSFLVYVSALSKHSSALKAGRKASLMVIEDEAAASQLFARKRATYTCTPVLIPRDTDPFDAVLDRMQTELGEVVAVLRNMVDFDLFRLRPEEGRLVVGFGRAFRMLGEGMRELSHIGGGNPRAGHKTTAGHEVK